MYDNYKDLAIDLQLDIKDAHQRISELEKALTEEKLARRQAELHVVAVKQDKQRAIDAMTMRLERYRKRAIPNGDLHSGYKCPECFCDIEWPEEQEYCYACGVKFDWRVYVDRESGADAAAYIADSRSEVDE